MDGGNDGWLPSWLGWDKWYVKAGAVALAAGAVTLVGYAHEKIYGEETPAGRGGPGAGMPPGLQGIPPELLGMLGMAGPPPSGGPKGAAKRPAAAGGPRLPGPAASAANRSRKSTPTEQQYELRLNELVVAARNARKQGDLVLAQGIYGEVIELVERVSQTQPGEKKRLFQPLQELAETASQLGQFDKAELAIRKTLDLIVEQLHYVPNNPSLQSSLVSMQLQLTHILSIQSKLPEAQEILEEILQGAEEGIRPAERGTLHSLYKRLLSVCLSQGLFDRCEQVCDVLESLPAPPSAPGAPSNGNLVLGTNRLSRGLLKLRQRLVADAKDIFESVLAKFVPRVESNSQKLTDITLRKAIAANYSEEGVSALAQEQYLDIYTRYRHFLDGGRTSSEETKTIRAAVYEALNDMVSELHNNGQDEEAHKYYDDFISRKCAVLSQSKFFHTGSAKVTYDINKASKHCILVFKLTLVRDPANAMKPCVPPGAVLVIKAETLDDWQPIETPTPLIESPVSEPSPATDTTISEPQPSAQSEAQPQQPVVTEPQSTEAPAVQLPEANDQQTSDAQSETSASSSDAQSEHADETSSTQAHTSAPSEDSTTNDSADTSSSSSVASSSNEAQDNESAHGEASSTDAEQPSADAPAPDAGADAGVDANVNPDADANVNPAAAESSSSSVATSSNEAQDNESADGEVSSTEFPDAEQPSAGAPALDAGVDAGNVDAAANDASEASASSSDPVSSTEAQDNDETSSSSDASSSTEAQGNDSVSNEAPPEASATDIPAAGAEAPASPSAEPSATPDADAASSTPGPSETTPSVVISSSSTSSSSSSSSSTSSSASSSAASSSSTPAEPKPTHVPKVRTYELLVTQEMIDAAKIVLEFPAESGSREHLYEVGIVVYSNASKTERIGYHHQLVNCLVNTHDISPAQFQHQIESRQLRYTPSPDAVKLQALRS